MAGAKLATCPYDYYTNEAEDECLAEYEGEHASRLGAECKCMLEYKQKRLGVLRKIGEWKCYNEHWI